MKKKHPHKRNLLPSTRSKLREAGQQWWGKLRKNRVVLDIGIEIFKRWTRRNPFAAPPKRQPCPKCSSWVKRVMWWTRVAQYYCRRDNLHFEVATNITSHPRVPAGVPGPAALPKEKVLALRQRPSRFRRAFDWLRQAIHFKSKIKPVRT